MGGVVGSWIVTLRMKMVGRQAGIRETLPLMASITWGAEVAEVYDKTYAAMFEPSVLGPMVGLLAELAGAALRWSSRSVPGGWLWG